MPGDRLRWVCRQSHVGSWIFAVLDREEQVARPWDFFSTKERGIEWAEEWICVKRAHRELTAMGQRQAAGMLRFPLGMSPTGAVERAYLEYKKLPSVALREDVWGLVLPLVGSMIFFGVVIPAINLAINALH